MAIPVDTPLRSSRLPFHLPLLVCLFLGLFVSPSLEVAAVAPPPAYLVNTNADLPDNNLSDAACVTSAGTCSLRAAVEQINHDNAGGTITFAGDYTISLGTSIDLYSNGITIDGSGHAVTVVGPTPAGFSVFEVFSNNNRIANLSVQNKQGYGIRIEPYVSSMLAQANDNTIDAVTIIGTDGAIYINGDLTHANIGNRNIIQNSRIGTTLASPTGCTAAEKLSSYGLTTYYAHDTTILNNQFVCSNYDGLRLWYDDGTLLSGNTIAGNGQYGISVSNNTELTLHGNFIGNQAGTILFANAMDGIYVQGPTTGLTIGGSGEGNGNVISGNGRNGIYLSGYNPSTRISGVAIDGNRIGVGSDGSSMPNSKGIVIQFSTAVTIGSADHSSVQQFVSANSFYGIEINNSDHVSILDSTLVGLGDWTSDDAEDVPAGNGQSGILLGSSATYITATPWMLSYNGGSGIAVVDSIDRYNKLIPANAYANGGIPVDLGNDGATPNDPGDSDSGANDLLNYPVIVEVHGSDLEGDACAYCTVYFYSAVGNPVLNGGGGRSDLGLAPAMVDMDGHWSATLPVGVRPWQVTMLTFDSSTNQTSEFSPTLPPYWSFLPILLAP